MMQRIAALTGLVLLVAVGCSSSSDTGDEASASSTTATEAVTSTSVVQMSIPEVTTPATTAGDPGAASTTGSGQVIMLKLHVGDIDDGEAFYHSVFGATVAYELGEGIRVLTMAEGPGFILIEDGPDDEDTWNSSFLIQVPDLATAEAAAVDNGATHQQAFEGSPGGQEARSVDLLDPWGNQIEILQLG
jgi:predicted enzyme related to lactoylglutathione lyase